MKYKLLGKSGIRVSELCLGTMTFGLDWGFGSSKEESKTVFDTFLNAGGNFLDTANIYTKGSSERILSEFIQTERNNLVIASKYTLSESGKINQAGNHRKNMVQSVEESLKRLNTDYIDLYYVHAWDFTVKPDELMRSLEYLVSSGKVVSIGISDAPAWITAKCNAIAELRGWSQFVAYQTEYSLTERTSDREIIPYLENEGMAMCGWAPLAAGLLSGKYLSNHADKKRMDPANSRRITDHTLEISRVVVDLSKRIGCSPSQLAINWTKAQAPNNIPIFGARTKAQIEDNLECLNWEISEEYMEMLEEISSIDMGFPHDFLKTDRIREVIYGGHFDNILC